jgi:hypothetical protein
VTAAVSSRLGSCGCRCEKSGSGGRGCQVVSRCDKESAPLRLVMSSSDEMTVPQDPQELESLCLRREHKNKGHLELLQQKKYCNAAFQVEEQGRSVFQISTRWLGFDVMKEDGTVIWYSCYPKENGHKLVDLCPNVDPFKYAWNKLELRRKPHLRETSDCKYLTD